LSSPCNGEGDREAVEGPRRRLKGSQRPQRRHSGHNGVAPLPRPFLPHRGRWLAASRRDGGGRRPALAARLLSRRQTRAAPLLPPGEAQGGGGPSGARRAEEGEGGEVRRGTGGRPQRHCAGSPSPARGGGEARPVVIPAQAGSQSARVPGLRFASPGMTMWDGSGPGRAGGGPLGPGGGGGDRPLARAGHQRRPGGGVRRGAAEDCGGVASRSSFMLRSVCADPKKGDLLPSVQTGQKCWVDRISRLI